MARWPGYREGLCSSWAGGERRDLGLPGNRLPASEEYGRQIADEVLAADLLLFDAELLAVDVRRFLHQVVAALRRHLVGAQAEGQEQLALLEADAMPDQAQHARRAQGVIAPPACELWTVGEGTRLADDECAGHHIAQPAPRAVEQRSDCGHAIEPRRGIERPDDISYHRLMQRDR